MAALFFYLPCAVKKKRPAKGFTFLELLVVLVLIGIFLALSLPELKKRFEHLLLNQEIRVVTQALRYAQYRAIADQVPVVFSIRSGENQYQIMKDEGGKEGIRWMAIPGEWGRPVQLKSQLEFEPSSEGIVYFPDGSSLGGSLSLRHQKTSAYLSVKPGLGHVKISVENET